MPADHDTRQPAAEPKASPAKARKRNPVKAGPDTGKRSLNLRIDDESYKRLSVHALMTGSTISGLVEGYAKSLRDFSMPHRLGGGLAGQGGQDDA